MSNKDFTVRDFKKELEIMPAYKWTIERTSTSLNMCAMGTISSGSNRTATLLVTRKINNNGVSVYTSKADTNFAWNNYLKMRLCERLYESVEVTLKQSLRNLQNYHESIANKHGRIANTLQSARKTDL